MFRQDPYPSSSLKKYLLETDNVHPLCVKIRPTGIYYISKIGVGMMKRFRIDEVLIESTF